MSSIIGSIVAKLSLNIKEFSSNLSKAQNDIKKAKKEMEGLGNLGSGLESVGSTLSKTVTLPIIGIGTAAVKASSDFEQAMSKVKAISGATASDMELLNEKAIEMGAKTKFSAKESAEAFTYMAMAGWDTKAMLDGIDGIMNLAAADGLDLATTSDIVTDAITAFGLSAKDSAHFADVLAVASSSSNTNVQMLGESFKYVAPVAGSLGYTIEDTAVALGLMANAGVKSSQAGTSLRAALTRMVKPTEAAAIWMEKLGIEIVNSDGSMKSLDEVMRILRSSMSGLTDEQKAQAVSTIFGQEAMSGMLAIINASDADFEKLTKSINNADGAAEEMAETMMDNTAGAIEQMMGSLETLGIQIGNILTPLIKKAANAIQQFSDWLGSLDKETQTLIVTIMAIAAAIGPLLFVVGKLITSFMLLKVYIGALSSTVLPVVAIIGALAAAIIYLWNTNEGFRKSITTAFNEMIEVVRPILSEISTALTTLWNEVLIPIVTWLLTVLAPVISTVITTIMSLIGPLIEMLQGVLDFLVGVFTGNWQMVWDGIVGIFSGAWNAIVAVVQGAISIVSSVLSAAWQIITTTIQNVWNTIVSLVSGAMEGLKSAISSGINTVISFFRGLLSSISGIFTSVTSTIKSWGSSAISAAKSAANSIISAISGVLTKLPSKALKWGKDMVDGFVKGIKNMIGSVGDVVSDIADTITGWLHFSRPDKGPLREYEKWMPDMVLGLANTLDKSKSKLLDSVKELANNMSKSFDPNLSLATTYGALNNDIGEYERVVNRNKKIDNTNNDKTDKPKGDGGVVINLTIEEFNNNNDTDIKDLTREIMEVAAEENKRKGGAFGDGEEK